MVATVGSIAVDLSANTAKFIAGFQKSATTVERESKRMSTAVSAFSKRASGIGSAFVGGIVAGGTLAAIGSLTGAIKGARDALSDFEEIGNRAKATGLSTDTFQAISHGASLADVEQETLNKSLEIFAKNVGLAKEGTGGLYSSLVKLNPQLLQSVLHATSQEERLKLVADAMANTADATDKAALATAVFGKGGAEMVRVLDKGAQSIDEMKRNAAELGIIVPEELIRRSGELDDKLTTLSTVIGVNMKEALAKAGPLLVSAAEGMVRFAKGLNELSTAITTFTNNKSLANFLELLKALGAPPEAIDVYKRLFAPDAADKIATLNKELYDTQVRMAEVGEQIKAADAEYAQLQEDIAAGDLSATFRIEGAKANAAELHAELDKLDAHAKGIKITMDATQAQAVIDKTRAAIDQLRSSDLAALWAEAEGRPTAGGRPLPNVYQGVNKVGAGGNAIDPETGEKIERAIEKETEATNRVAARATDVYRGVQQFDAHSAGYFDRLGSQIEGGLQTLSYSVREGSGYATGDAASSFKFSGLGSKSSWGGRQMTFGGGGPSNNLGKLDYDNMSKLDYRMGANTVEDASTITSGAATSNAVNVNVVVRPVMEGSRLSGQSTAEIKQAASAGANAALRAYYGR